MVHGSLSSQCPACVPALLQSASGTSTASLSAPHARLLPRAGVHTAAAWLPHPQPCSHACCRVQVFTQPLPDHQTPLHALALSASLMRAPLPLPLPHGHSELAAHPAHQLAQQVRRVARNARPACGSHALLTKASLWESCLVNQGQPVGVVPP